MPGLELTDTIYGKVRLTEPVLLELLASPSLQRLKGLNQFGLPAELYPYPCSFSRFDHSVGVCLLLRQLGASVEDQVVGLLHDVSHRAFSHVYDWLAASSQPGSLLINQQDTVHQKFLLQSELPAILNRYHLNPVHLAELCRYPLVDRPLPHLCADRIDYSLRELPVVKAKAIAKQLTITNGRIVCRSVVMAQQFAQAYLNLQQKRWGSTEYLARYQIFAQVLRRSLELGLITETDFWLDDQAVINKILPSTDPTIQRYFGQLRQPHLRINSLAHSSLFRYIDPEVIFGHTTKRLTEIHHRFSLELYSAQAAHHQSSQSMIATVAQ